MEKPENTAQQTNSGQQSTQPTPKEIEIEEKKKSFYLKIKLLGLGVFVFIVIIILFTVGRYIYINTKSTYVANPETEQTLPEQEIIINPEEEEEVEEWEIYSSDKYRFAFDYPKGDSLTVTDVSENEFSVEVRHKDIIPDENPDGQNMIKGYIFRVVPLKLSASDITSAALAKRDWFFSQCPDTATINSEYGNTIGGFDAVSFDVFDCNSNYSISYVAANNFVYEVSRVYKGDLGFKQIYKSRLNQILYTLVIETDRPELSPNATHYDKVGFSFDYPRGMDAGCCWVPPPPQEELQNHITLAENDSSHAIGFFYTYRNSRIDFYSYVEEHKTKLIDEYKIVKNKEPETTETELGIAGQKAIMLSGYSWRGNDLIYIPFTPKQNVLVISKTDLSEDAFNTIINSLEFN